MAYRASGDAKVWSTRAYALKGICNKMQTGCGQTGVAGNGKNGG